MYQIVKWRSEEIGTLVLYFRDVSWQKGLGKNLKITFKPLNAFKCFYLDSYISEIYRKVTSSHAER